MAELRPVVGILLAAGAGTRMGGPKALVGPLAGKESPVSQVAGWMHEGGCQEVVVVIGARAAEVRARLADRPWLSVVEAPDWSRGMGASLRAGLTYARAGVAAAALVSLVDLPDVRTPVFERLHALADQSESVLARAVYEGRPGHPVLIGRTWWATAAELAKGDMGARELFATQPHRLIECGDLASGEDVDLPPDTTTPSPGV
ncbi:MAG: nucleotidyltransferase family protein [Actinomycetota bacterium]